MKTRQEKYRKLRGILQAKFDSIEDEDARMRYKNALIDLAYIDTTSLFLFVEILNELERPDTE